MIPVGNPAIGNDFSEIVMALIENEKLEQRTKLIPAFKSVFQWFKGNIEKDLKDNWIDKSAQIFDIINKADSNIYFIFDEFPIAIDKMDQKDAEEFLHWFRKLRQVSPDLRFIVGGVNVINDFKRVRVDGFQKQIAIDLIKNVFMEEGWTYAPSYGDKILGCIGEAYIPYFIAIMLSSIKEEYILRDGEINDELIEKIYNFRILGNEGKHYFEHYSQRLNIFYSDMGEKAARAILKNVCNVDFCSIELAFGIFKQETANDDYDKFMDLIADLSNDFYLEHDPENGLKFYSKMLQDWWRIYHGEV